ncbi:MAG: hypothetical protein V7K21_12350 [Nostoc sp.]
MSDSNFIDALRWTDETKEKLQNIPFLSVLKLEPEFNSWLVKQSKRL